MTEIAGQKFIRLGDFRLVNPQHIVEITTEGDDSYTPVPYFKIVLINNQELIVSIREPNIEPRGKDRVFILSEEACRTVDSWFNSQAPA